MQHICETSTVADGNMSFKYGERETVSQNRLQFLQKLGLASRESVMMDSDHEDKVAIVTEPRSNDGSVDADALITQTPNLALLLLTGDCLPITFFDQVTRTIGLMHLSRHTFCLDLIEKTLALLQNDLAVDSQNLAVHIGPHIKKESYSFPLPLHEEPEKLVPYIEKAGDTAHVNLTQAAIDTLTAGGVRVENVAVSPVDTFTDQNYFSHVRAVKASEPEGRIMTAVALVVPH